MQASLQDVLDADELIAEKNGAEMEEQRAEYEQARHWLDTFTPSEPPPTAA